MFFHSLIYVFLFKSETWLSKLTLRLEFVNLQYIKEFRSWIKYMKNSYYTIWNYKVEHLIFTTYIS